MSLRFTIIILIATSLKLSGCGGSTGIPVDIAVEASRRTFEPGLTEMIRSINADVIVPDNLVNVAIPQATLIENWEEPLDSLVMDHLFKDLRFVNQSTRLTPKQFLKNEMESLGLLPTEENLRLHAKVWKNIGCDAIIFYRILPYGEDSIQIGFNVYVKSDLSEPIYKPRRRIAKDGYLRKLIDEQGPGWLLVRSNRSGANMSVDGGHSDRIGRDWSVRRLSSGHHNLSVTLEGYPRFDKSVRVPQGDFEKIEVEFSRPNAATGLATWMSLALPGSASYKYHPEPGESRRALIWNRISAVLTYIGIGTLIANNNASDEFLSDVDPVIYSVLGCYAINVLTSAILGEQWANAHTKVREVDR